MLRLPPYHCDLNAIELIWSLAKKNVGSKNVSRTPKEFEDLIKQSFECITADDWKKMTDHVIHVEDKYKRRDHITENSLESFIINLRDSSDSSDSDDSLHVEFLDSDFDYSD